MEKSKRKKLESAGFTFLAGNIDGENLFFSCAGGIPVAVDTLLDLGYEPVKGGIMRPPTDHIRDAIELAGISVATALICWGVDYFWRKGKSSDTSRAV